MKRLLLVIGVILLVLLVLGFIAPKEYVLNRDILISAPKSHVYNQYISSLEGLHSWRNDLVLDSTSEIEYTGTPGTVGSQAKWKSCSGAREGREEVMRVVPLNKIETQIRFIKPWESLNHAQIFIEEKGDELCRVNFRFQGHNPFPFNIQHLFIDMDHKMGVKFEGDLKQLKILAGKSYLIERLSMRFDQWPQQVYRVVLDSLTTAADARQTAFAHFDNQMNKYKKMAEKPFISPAVIEYQTEAGGRVFEAIEIRHDSLTDAGPSEEIVIPAGESLIAQYLGDFKHLDMVHLDIEKHLQSEGIAHSWPVLEDYVIHPGVEPDTSKWLTIIRYSLKDID